MENEITVATFKEAVRGLDGPERTADLIVALVKERDDLKSLLKSAEAHIDQDLKVQIKGLRKVNYDLMTRAEELDDLLQARDGLVARQSILINRLHEERDQAQMGAKLQVASLEGLINDLKAENKALETQNDKLRAAVVQAPFTPSHVCSRECTPECTHD